MAERARRGGFTYLLVGGWHGWAEPALIAQVRKETQEAAAWILPLASWADEKGNIAPLESLRAEGAVGWCLPPHQSLPWRTLIQVLPYVRYLGGPLFLLPFWESAGGETGVPETPLLALAGWEGIPPYAETIAIHIIATLHRTYGGNLWVGPITTQEGLYLTRQYGLPAFTGLAYVVADAEKLLSYDPRWKLHPPLRAPEDRQALLAALHAESITIAAWDLAPPIEEKHREWATAAVGQPVLEYFAQLLWTALQAGGEKNELVLSRLVRLLAERPRAALGLPAVSFQRGHPIDFTVFRIEEEAQPLPKPWEAYMSSLRVLGTIRCLADAHNLQSHIA